MYGNDESHKRAARRRLQRLALAAALVASTTATASAIDPPVTPATASDAAAPSLPPLPVNIGRLGTGPAPAERIAPSAVKGIRHNPFLIPAAATDGVVARVSGTETQAAAMPESTPRLLRPTAPVLSLRPIAPPDALAADQPTTNVEPTSKTAGETPSGGARFTLGDQDAPDTAHSAPRADHATPSATEETLSSPAGGRVSFAISDDGVRATATLGQPDTATESDSNADAVAVIDEAAIDEEAAIDDQAPRLPSRTPRMIAAAAPAFDVDLPDAASEAHDAEDEEMAADPRSTLDADEPLESPQSVLADDSAQEADATATLARPTARISAVADRQPVVIAKPSTPVGRPLPQRENAAAPSEAIATDATPEAKLAKPNRTLVIDAPAGRRPLARVAGDTEFQLPPLADVTASSNSPAANVPREHVPTDNVPTDNVPTDNVPTDNVPADNVPAGNLATARSAMAVGDSVAASSESASTESVENAAVAFASPTHTDAPTSESVGAGEGAAAASAQNVMAQTVMAEAIRLQSAETRTITPTSPVRRVQLEDREICEAVLVGPHKLLLIGRRDGTTRLAVWSSDQREPALYEVTVVSRQAAPSQSPLHAVAQRLTETIAATYPHCHVQVVPAGDGLKVNGRVDSDDSAREIMRLVRRACLKSVTDNLVIR